MRFKISELNFYQHNFTRSEIQTTLANATRQPRELQIQKVVLIDRQRVSELTENSTTQQEVIVKGCEAEIHEECCVTVSENVVESIGLNEDGKIHITSNEDEIVDTMVGEHESVGEVVVHLESNEMGNGTNADAESTTIEDSKQPASDKQMPTPTSKNSLNERKSNSSGEINEDALRKEYKTSSTTVQQNAHYSTSCETCIGDNQWKSLPTYLHDALADQPSRCVSVPHSFRFRSKAQILRAHSLPASCTAPPHKIKSQFTHPRGQSAPPLFYYDEEINITGGEKVSESPLLDDIAESTVSVVCDSQPAKSPYQSRVNGLHECLVIQKSQHHNRLKMYQKLAPGGKISPPHQCLDMDYEIRKKCKPKPLALQNGPPFIENVWMGNSEACKFVTACKEEFCAESNFCNEKIVAPALLCTAYGIRNCQRSFITTQCDHYRHPEMLYGKSAK